MNTPLAALLALMLGIGITTTALSLDDHDDSPAIDGATAADRTDEPSPLPPDDTDEEPEGKRAVPQDPLDRLERFREELGVPDDLFNELRPFFSDPEFFFDDDGSGRFFFEAPPGGGDRFGDFRFDFSPRGFGLPDVGLIDELLETGAITPQEADQLREARDLLDEVLQREPASSS